MAAAYSLFLRFFAVVPFFCFLGALPPLHKGIWINTEGVAWLLCMGLGVCLLLRTFQVWSGQPVGIQKDTIELTITPLHGIMGIMAFLSLINLAVGKHPSLSWTGHPEVMMGGWLWVALFSYLILLEKLSSHAQPLALSGVLSIFLLTIFFHPLINRSVSNTNWILYPFVAYLSWVGLSFLLLSFKESGKERLVLLGLGILSVVLSQAKLAIAGLGIGYGSFFLIKLFFPQKHHFKAFLGVLIALPLLYGVVPFAAFNFQVFPTLISRYISAKVVVHALLEQPWYGWILGNGWGEMGNLVAKQHAVLSSLQILNDDGVYSSWEGLSRYDGSSLNQSLDALYAVGIGGTICMCFFAMAPFLLHRFSGESGKDFYQDATVYSLSVASSLMTYGWFPMLSVLPLWIATLYIVWPKGWQIKISHPVFLISLIGASAVLFLTASRI